MQRAFPVLQLLLFTIIQRVSNVFLIILNYFPVLPLLPWLVITLTLTLGLN
jgi:hypothetical protein